jgi:hypothetical protein
MNSFFKRHAGIIIGAVYALVLRLIFNIQDLSDAYSLFSVTFVWITPIIIGLIPLFFASADQLKSWQFRITGPALTVLVFFTLCFVTKIEDLICIWVILIPYAAGAMFAGLIAGEIIQRMKKRKKALYSIIFLPLILCPIEQQFDSPVSTYSVATKTTINSSPEVIWQNIIRVREISNSEYSKGFFNYAGIPRPLYAELDKDTLGATRTGHFEGGLQFIEKVTYWEQNKHIEFDITVVPSTIRQTVFDQHMLKGGHFKFLNAGYTLTELPDGQTELTLTSSYQLNTKINFYASWCGNKLLADFQERLLKVVKARSELINTSNNVKWVYSTF